MQIPVPFIGKVYLGGRWYSFDARHNRRRIGRIVIARGRDAVDVPITMVFANHHLEKFNVVTEEVEMNGEYHGGSERRSNLSQFPRSEVCRPVDLAANRHRQ
jgi:transglutaminase-like putative cysteine protease